MPTLTSYVAGRWQEGTGEPRALLDPTSGETVAQLPSGGIDFAEMTRYAREVGGPALRAMNFAERGQLLKDLSTAIHAEREELIELGRLCGGNTRGDAKFDIDGATGTLAAYAHYARSLGERKILPDGEGVQLGRTARFWGQHILSPRVGVAVHINAFNFPIWGMLEKFAPAFLAGMPCIVKPATATSYLTEAAVRVINDSGLLPEGALQLIIGGTGDLLDRLEEQDFVTFTGSASTALKLKNHPNIMAKSIPFNAEADSLNSAIMAPDVTPDDEEFDIFAKEVTKEMTAKAGQKCTAIRRVLGPAEHLDALAERIKERLGKITFGNPAAEGVRMGALASRDQLRDVNAAIDRLLASSECI